MPPKTRKKSGRSKASTDESGTNSSSEGPEYTKSLEIITKLSQKYLNTGKVESSKKGSKTVDQEIGYEGDEENSTGSATSSSGSPYDFEDEPMSEDSPTIKKGKSKKNKSKKKTSQQPKQNKQTIKTKEKAQKKVQNKSVTFTGIPESTEDNLKFPKTPIRKSPVVALEKLDVQMIEDSQRQLRKRKVDTPETVTSVSKNLSTKKECVEKINPEPKIKKSKISASIVKPPLPGKIVHEMVQDTSTPNEIVRTKALRKSGNDSCFGFDEIKRTSLPVSPVRRVPITPMSDYASMDTFSHDVSMEDSVQKSKSPSPTLFSMEEDDFVDLQVNKSINKSYSKPKKRWGTKKQQQFKSNEWAEKIEKMSEEFKEIESFELSIEQD